MPIQDVEHVKTEITRIFGDSDVRHYEQVGSQGQKYHLFENHEAVYCACHVSRAKHTPDDFWNAIAMTEAQKSGIAIRYHETGERDATIDYLIDYKDIEKGSREAIAKKLFHSMRTGEKYLALVRVPFGFQQVRFDELRQRNPARIARLGDYKGLAAEIAAGIAALIRHDWGIKPVDYSAENDGSEEPVDKVADARQGLLQKDVKTA